VIGEGESITITKATPMLPVSLVVKTRDGRLYQASAVPNSKGCYPPSVVYLSNA